ncbi:hypothetical protein [Halorubrum tropicale]|uniref:hypothetical protein n=1 Tax=Halorubrum tropicale TaxID=1765655 RepID=UPI0011122A60|nr:hypothetical protein [Halorubrum tropicale]
MDDLHAQTVDGLVCGAAAESVSREQIDRFHGFHTSISEVGNEKPQDGKSEFTDFTDFTPSEMGVYVASPHPPARSRARLNTYTPFSRCEIRETREIARRRRGKSPTFDTPGVKGVKSPVGIDMEATL